MSIPWRNDPLQPRPVPATTEYPTHRPWFAIASEVTLTLLRIVAGLMFMQHGVQKHFGLLLDPSQPFRGAPAFPSQMWIAGTLEIAGGALIVLGLFTRPVAFLLSGEMAVAYFQVHAKMGFFPIMNHGEVPALYAFVFLMFAAVGGGPYSLDGLFAHFRNRAPKSTTAEIPGRKEIRKG